jgi:hypothetical protein
VRWCLGSIVLVAGLALARDAFANGGDLPQEIALKGFAKVEDGRIRLVVRTPLLLLASFSLPKRGPGYLDLARIDDALTRAAEAAGRQIAFSEDNVQLVPTVRASRLSVLSDRSFSSYATARAHVEGPPLPVDTDLFWNQGFFDTELEYPVRSAGSALSVRVAPELGRRVLCLISPADGAIRSWRRRAAGLRRSNHAGRRGRRFGERVHRYFCDRSPGYSSVLAGLFRRFDSLLVSLSWS